MISTPLAPIPGKAKSAILDLYCLSLDADEPKLYSAAIEAAVTVTRSEIGYFHLVNEDQETVELGTWSAATLRQCQVVYQRHYPISAAGIWADCARHRRPYIHNDYQGLTRKQGYPEGHVHLLRHLGVPVVYDDRVALLVGVGNKPVDYDNEDLACVQAIADHAWSLIRRCRQRVALEHSEQQLRDLQELAAICLWQWDPADQKLHCDNNIRRIFAADPSSNVPCSVDSLLRFIDPQDHTAVLDVLHTASASSAFDLELRGIRADGIPLILHFRGTAYPRSQGRGITLRGILQDITERKRAEAALRESERRHRELVEALQAEQGKLAAVIENLPVGVGISDPHGTILSLNKAGLELHGFNSEEEMFAEIGQYVGRFELRYLDGWVMPVEEWPASRAGRGEFVRNYDLCLRNMSSGSERIVSYSVAPVRNNQGETVLIVYVMQDLTEQKQAEEALRRSEERFRVAQELSLDAFNILSAVRDSDGRIVDFRWEYANPAAGHILKRAPDDLVGRRLLELFPGHRDQSDLFTRYVRVIETGEPHDIELKYEADDIAGYFRNMCVKLGDGIAVYFNDITGRKRAEEALREADRRKDEFLAMLAHELRNPLAPIRNAVQILRRADLSETRIAWCHAVINRQVEHLVRLVDDLLDVSRITRGKIELRKEPLVMADIVQRAVETSQPVIDARHHKLSVLLPREPIRIEGDFVRLAQVISNLLNNAAKYTDEGGQIRLSVEREGGEVAIRVRDTGRGIDPGVLRHLFDLFYQVDRTLDRTEGGLGIGLSLVKNLVAMHGGTVQAFSEGRGLGSEFVIRLPCLEDRPTGETGDSTTPSVSA